MTPRFRIYAETAGRWHRVGRTLAHLGKALRRLAHLGNAEVREVRPSGQETLYAVKINQSTALTVSGDTLTIPH